MGRVTTGGRPSTLHDHIRELRNRIFFLAIIFIGSSSLAYNYKSQLIAFLLKPLGDQKLIYLNPGGGFSFIFSITMYVGAAITIPFLVYHLYRFVAPALPKSAQKHSAVVLLSSLVLLITGAAFGYIYAIPGALSFLNHFADGYVNASLTADSYLSFILAYTAGLGILFQLPLILLFIHWIHPLKPGGLLKFERYMVLVAFIAAALITPSPDILNQTIMALPIIVMYQVGVIAVSVSVYRTKRRKSHSTAETQPVNATKAMPVLIPTQQTSQAAIVTPSVVLRPTPQRRSFDIMSVESHGKLPPVRSRPAAQIRIPDRPHVGIRPPQRMRSIDGISIVVAS